MEKIENMQVSLQDIINFVYDTEEDYQLWDETEHGPYPSQRIIDAMKNFIGHHKLAYEKHHEKENL